MAYSKICQSYSVHGYPTLKYFNENSEEAMEVPRGKLNVKSLHSDFFKKFSNFGKDAGNDGVDSSVDSSVDKTIAKSKFASKLHEDDKTGPQEHTQAHRNDVYIDAASSLSYGLRTSIFMTMEALSPEQEKVFKDWMILLSKTIPRQNSAMKESLHQIDLMISNLDSVVKSEENLLQILDQTKHEEKWTKSCMAGYTCGLWQLLHIVTIGLVHYNDSVGSSTTETALSTMETADQIRNYIEYYFTCDECRKNFVQMYEACQFNRCNRLSYDIGSKSEWKQLALWLWETHNDVNVRLLHENRATSNDSRKVTPFEEQEARWPSKSECSSCWQDGGGWNEEIVYSYLESFYWCVTFSTCMIIL